MEKHNLKVLQPGVGTTSVTAAMRFEMICIRYTPAGDMWEQRLRVLALIASGQHMVNAYETTQHLERRDHE